MIATGVIALTFAGIGIAAGVFALLSAQEGSDGALLFGPAAAFFLSVAFVLGAAWLLLRARAAGRR